MAHFEINKQSIHDSGLSRHISVDSIQGRVESKRRFSRLSVEWPSCLLVKVRGMLFLIVSVSMAALGAVNIHNYVMIRLE